MNSDNFDSFFKEQTLSLDHVAVPDSRWNPEAGWEKVETNLNKPRRKIISWFSAAATIIILLGLYFLMFQPINRNQKMLTDTSIDKASPLSNTEKTITTTKVENPSIDRAIVEENTIQIENQNQFTSLDLRKPESAIAFMGMITLKSLQLPYISEREVIPYHNEMLAINFEKPKSKNINRTYVINEPKQNLAQSRTKNRNFTFKLGSKKETSSPAPKGMLAGL